MLMISNGKKSSLRPRMKNVEDATFFTVKYSINENGQKLIVRWKRVKMVEIDLMPKRFECEMNLLPSECF